MIKYFELRAKTYTYLIDDGRKFKNAKRRKKFVINLKLIKTV